jgi:hypothetical protein
MTISYPLRPPQPNRFNPVVSPSEPRNASLDRKDVARDDGETPKTDANIMVGPQLEGSE